MRLKSFIFCLLVIFFYLPIHASWVDVDGVGLSDINVSNNIENSEAPSLCLDSSENPHIAWSDYTSTTPTSEIYYLQWNGLTWVDVTGGGQTNIDVSGNTGNSMNPSIALDSVGNPHIAWVDDTFGNNEIFYSYWNGSAWTNLGGSADISNNTGNSQAPSLKLDSSGIPHIAWMDDTSGNWEIYYLYWNGIAWVDVTGSGQANIDIYGNTGNSMNPSLALGSSGNPHIAWTDDTFIRSYIFYLWWDGTAWVDVDGAGQESIVVASTFFIVQDGSAGASSLYLDSFNNPHIAWNEMYFLIPTMCYSKWNGSTWKSADNSSTLDMIDSLIKPVGGFSFFGKPSLCLDSSNNPNIAYDGIVGYSSGVGTAFISFSQYNGSAWVRSSGFGFSSVGIFTDSGYPSLYLDNLDVPHIAYGNGSTGNAEIYFVHWVSDTPTPTVTETLLETTTPTITETTTPTLTPTVTPTITFTFTATITPTITPTETQCVGEGTASINPVQIIGSSTGNTIVIEYTAGPTAWINGDLYFELSAGWGDLSFTSTDPGFTSITITGGTINSIIISPGFPRFFVITTTSLQANTGKITITYGDKNFGGPGVTAAPCLASGNTETSKFTLHSKPIGGGPFCEIADSPKVELLCNTPTITHTYSSTPTETITPPQTQTPILFATNTQTLTITRTITPSITGTETVTFTTIFTFSNTPTITLTMTVTPTMTPYPEGDIVVYPNPFNPNEAVGGVLKIINLPIGAKVLIYTLSGELTTSFTQTPVVLWNGKNSYSNAVSSGIYYYVIKSVNDRVIRTGKIFVFH